MVAAVERVLADPRGAEARARAGRALAVERYDWAAARAAGSPTWRSEVRPAPTKAGPQPTL